MENVFDYFEFGAFFKDCSGAFSNNKICVSELNATHFLIFESDGNQYNLYVAKYKNRSEVGVKLPEIIELLVKNYNKSIPAHRIAIRQYFE